MKTFAVYTNLRLLTLPPGLEDFQKHYYLGENYHITLKQPCYVEEKDVEALREKADKFLSEIRFPGHKIELDFSECFTSREEDGVTVMVRTRNPLLIKLQKDLCEVLCEYKNYVNPCSRSWEENFDPHVTIGRCLSDAQLAAAMPFLHGMPPFQGIVDEIVLSIVKDDTAEEVKNPANKRHYKF